MRTLVIDTATQILSVALFDGKTLIARHHEAVGRGHAERLLPVIAAMPYGGQADRIAVDVGPGSFTGVRIGLAAARALAYAWGVSLSGYSALALTAAGIDRPDESADAIAVAMTGGHGELFWQIFDSASREARSEVASTPIAQLATTLDQHIIHGSGAPVLVAARGFGEAVPAWPDSAIYMQLPQTASNLPPTPLYGRGADAKPMAVGSSLT